MAGASGPICGESELHGNIAKQFNNQELSDITLKVGEKSYYAHRFVLASHSTVFKIMLMNGQWKESDQQIIKLKEKPECEAVFEQFLKFLYSGKVSPTDRNLCGIHMLADKYDVPVLKAEAETAMKAFLSGTDGNALQSSIVWLRYIEQFVPEILPMCYEAIRTNFEELCYNDELINKLNSRDIMAILTSSDIVVSNEMSIFEFVSNWARWKFSKISPQRAVDALKPILELVRFYNIDAENLQVVEDSDLCKAIGKSFINDFLFPAYKMHSQMQRVGLNRSKNPSENNSPGPGECPYDCGDDCLHLNPRLYIFEPYGKQFHFKRNRSKNKEIIPVDLEDIRKYSKLQLCLGDECNPNDSWNFGMKKHVESAPTHENEIFTLTPSSSHAGRQYTVVIMAVIISATRFVEQYLYTMKRTGTVDENNTNRPITIQIESPARPTGTWTRPTETNDGEKLLIGVTVHLHK